ncbi:MAG: hydrogenase expression/formation protein HypE [Magnetococcales bacterium]|nr:hydrogenase expression/formation protein HypE [Magnetococcales bacterium]
MDETHISLAHGNGGRFMRALIRDVFARHLSNPLLNTDLDAAILPWHVQGEMVVTTDGFTVEPLTFPGGDIGALAVHGTVNDLAVAGADPLYLTVNAFIEEGFPIEQLEQFVVSMAQAAKHMDVKVIAGDTKVVPRGGVSGVFFATTGIGVRPESIRLMPEEIQDGDVILVSGPIGDHGTAVMLAREQFGLSGDLLSDAASVYPITRMIRDIEGVRFMRDPTRGGLVTVAHEVSRMTGMTVRLKAGAIPVRDSVRMVCEILGYDPYYLACEGRLVVITSPDSAAEVLKRMRQAEGGAESCIIGQLQTGAAQVVMETELGGERIIPELEDDPLPRIC